MLVGPPVVGVVCRLVDLRLLLKGGVLAALSSAALWGEERVDVSCPSMPCFNSSILLPSDRTNLNTLNH